jgi:cobalt-precorrin 5A hydrolase
MASGHAGHPVGVGQAMMVAGIGCRRGASAASIEAAVVAACAQAGVATSELQFIATSAAKGDEPGIAAAASAIGVPLLLVSQCDLTAASGRTTTRSERVVALTGVPSVAEAAALAAGGPAARLIAPRIAVGPVTCALAETEGVMAYGGAMSSPSPLVGEGWGGGSGSYGLAVPHSSTPTPDPSPQGGGENRCPAVRDSSEPEAGP